MNRRQLLTLAPATLVAGAGLASSSHAAGGLYVAVGYGGRRMSSRDGVNWENVQEWAASGGDDSNNLMSVTFGKGRFVAAGGGGWTRETQAGHILASSDGARWSEVARAANRIHPVVFGDGRFIGGMSDKTLVVSDDGLAWRRAGTIDYPGWAFWFRSGAAGNGRFVFTGNSTPGQKECWCAVTRNGESIEHFSTDFPLLRSVAFGAGRFVLTGRDGLRMSSVDGKTWEHRVDEPGEDLRTIVWTGKHFVTAGGAFVFTSPDGIVWEKRAQRSAPMLMWGDERLIIATAWPGRMFSSTDGGVRWTPSPALPPNGVNQVAYGVPLPSP